MYTKKEIAKNFAWKLGEGIGDQSINFVISIILARILSPTDYGLIALTSIFMNLASKLVLGGINTALIQKKEIDDTDISTAFFITLGSSFAIFLILYNLSPAIAEFYNNSELVLIIKILSFQVFITALSAIQYALIIKKMKFKLWCIANIVSGIISGCISIYLAINGKGVWALVTYQLLKSVITQLVLWFTLKWRPQIIFSMKSALSLWRFGYKVLLGSIIEFFNNNICEAIIGKKSTKAQLGFYSKGKQFPTLFMTVTNNAITTILLPVLAADQDSKNRIKNMMATAIASSFLFLLPALIGLMIIAKNLVVILLTPKWVNCVPILQLECLYYVSIIIQQANLQVFNAVGRSDINLWLEFIRFILNIPIIFLTIPYGIIALEIARVSVSFILMFISIILAQNMALLDIKLLFNKLNPIIVTTFIMAVFIIPLGKLQISPMLIIILQILTGIFMYSAICWKLNIGNAKTIITKYKKNFPSQK